MILNDRWTFNWLTKNEVAANLLTFLLLFRTSPSSPSKKLAPSATIPFSLVILSSLLLHLKQVHAQILCSKLDCFDCNSFLLYTFPSCAFSHSRNYSLSMLGQFFKSNTHFYHKDSVWIFSRSWARGCTFCIRTHVDWGFEFEFQGFRYGVHQVIYWHKSKA